MPKQPAIWREIAKRPTETVRIKRVTVRQFRRYWDSLGAVQRIGHPDMPRPSLMFNGCVVLPRRMRGDPKTEAICAFLNLAATSGEAAKIWSRLKEDDA